MLRAEAEEAAGASGYIGLGRSVFRLLGSDLVSHALEQLRNRMERHEASPAVVFMAALEEGRLVRARIAPVAAVESATAEGSPVGFVLLLEDIAEDVERAERADAWLQALAQNVRSALAGVRAAVENLMNFPDMDVARRRQFTGIIGHEADRLTIELDSTMRDYSRHVQSRRSLEEMRAADLIEVIRHRLHQRLHLEARVDNVDASIWVKVDSYTIVQAVCYLVSRLKAHCGVDAVCLSAAGAGRHARLDLAWTGPPLSASTALAWEDEALTVGGEASSLTFREVLDRHHAEAWYESGDATRPPCFRLLLPLGQPGDASRVPEPAGRPVDYDFDLFHRADETRELDDRPLKALTYTAFDTETTGLEPSAGDEIISIGAIRIVNGRLLTGEIFDQLIDPRRTLQAASIAIHGIRPEMLEGQPTIDKVLPAFHRFCEDTVLIGHNAAFDMRFLALKERATGVRFTQPLLDTLLLSAVLHGNLVENEHQLEAIAARFGIEVRSRHAALADAMMTGEVLLRMIPLLEERGIVTLKQAREACERTRYARLRY
jgi:DNA polymerase-3 subunit epsilon